MLVYCRVLLWLMLLLVLAKPNIAMLRQCYSQFAVMTYIKGHQSLQSVLAEDMWKHTLPDSRTCCREKERERIAVLPAHTQAA